MPCIPHRAVRKLNSGRGLEEACNRIRSGKGAHPFPQAVQHAPRTRVRVHRAHRFRTQCGEKRLRGTTAQPDAPATSYSHCFGNVQALSRVAQATITSHNSNAQYKQPRFQHPSSALHFHVLLQCRLRPHGNTPIREFTDLARCVARAKGIYVLAGQPGT